MVDYDEETEQTLISLKNLKTKRKDAISIVFIGHVDAGKSTIGGQVLNLLGLIDERTLEKYQKQAAEKNRESWYLSWALDVDEGERERGKTAEVGRACFELDKHIVFLLDAPGHSMYVSDMISGANLADVAILVVSARTSEFEAGFEKDGQTREHVYLSRAAGIKKMIILVNKMDEVDWLQERFEYIKTKLGVFLNKIYNQVDIIFIPVSGYKGLNIFKRFDSFYDGPSFLEFLDEMKIDRKSEDYFAFRIIDKIKLMGLIYLEGKVEMGKLQKSEVKIIPGGVTTSIDGIFDDEDVEINEGFPGEFVKIRLNETPEEICEGCVIIHKNSNFFMGGNEFSCALNILEAHNIVSVGYQCVLHLGLFKTECKIVGLAVMTNGKQLEKIRFAKKGEKILAKIKTNNPVVFNYNDGAYGDMFALRNENITVALGIVKKVMTK